ncbi:MAG: guanylate kinase [Gammaproteobacteria bacterium]|nr:guanylate kinase [Gammaproteobacteria bacterium]
MQPHKAIVISAPSGAGKTTLIRALLAEHPHLEHVVTHTTRALRQGEINGKDYHFIDAPRFEQYIKEDYFIEWARVHGEYYGTSKSAIQKILDAGKHPILNIDWQGARRAREIYDKNLISIFILPPSLQELECRLKKRGDSEANIQKRLAMAEAEISHAQDFDHIITNDQFDQTLLELKSLIPAHS